MTYLQTQTRLHLGLQRDDLTASEGSAINEAIREICRLRNWACMKTVTRITMAAGDTAVDLPADFKAFNTTRTPVHEVVDGTTLAPVAVLHREQAERLQWNTGGISSTYGWTGVAKPSVPVLFYDWSGGTPLLYSPDLALGTSTVFEISYFAFLTTLTNDISTNFFLTNWPDMVIQRAKSILLTAINDDEGDKALKRFSAIYASAAMADARELLSGIVLRM